MDAFDNRLLFDTGVAFAAVLGLLSKAVLALTVRRPYQQSHFPGSARLLPLAVVASSAGAAYLFTRQIAGAVAVASITLGVMLAIRTLLPRLTWAGALELSVAPVALVTLAPWSYSFLRDAGFPKWSLTAWLVLLIPGLALAVFSFASNLAATAVMTHHRWRRPVRPLAPIDRHAEVPKVSLHLCCYSEPPEVVIRTIDHLARLDYSNYEVLVCDNNTEDPALWLPLQAHCAELNRSLGFERFRFFHVSPLEGAKAGALNFCLDNTAEDAKLIGVLDADYFSRADFLSRLVGFFDDPKVGYVQTSHDYRDFKFSRYLRMSYWEYLPYYKVDMASINEYGAGFTIGTMCLFRRSALEDCGRWAEWCLTEDSEVSIRIRALGYEGYFLRSTAGRGLIPELFEHYKKQRFRWTAGPVQQLQRHWRLFIPNMLGGRSRLNGWSKLLEFQRAFECAFQGPAVLLGVAGLATLLGLTATGVLPRVVIPDLIWMLMPLGLATAVVKKWLWYRLAGCYRVSDMVGGEIARMSLTYVKLTASFAGMSSKPKRWFRTPKFKAESLGAKAILSALPETILGMLFIGVAAALWIGREAFGAHVALLAAVAAAGIAMTFLSSTLMAILSERALSVGDADGMRFDQGSDGQTQPPMARAKASEEAA